MIDVQVRSHDMHVWLKIYGEQLCLNDILELARKMEFNLVQE